MSLTNVLLLHVSTMFLPPPSPVAEEGEYYDTLDHLPKYSALPEIRKAFRRVTLQIQCDRMMLEWQQQQQHNSSSSSPPSSSSTSLAALDERERKVREAFRVLGDKHLRQQYHLLQCRPSRYRILRGPVARIHSLTHARKWFPLLILQSVIMYVCVNYLS